MQDNDDQSNTITADNTNEIRCRHPFIILNVNILVQCNDGFLAVNLLFSFGCETAVFSLARLKIQFLH